MLSSIDGGKEAYNYDAVGLRGITTPRGSFVYGASGQLASIGNVSYSYDENGHRISKSRDGRVEQVRWANIVATRDDLLEPLVVEGVSLGIIRNGRFIPTNFDARGSLQGMATVFGERKDHSEFADFEFTLSGYDADSGLIRLGNRDYDPSSSKFTTPDLAFWEDPELCVEDPVSCNLFSYARNNPLKYVDPSGNIPMFPVILGGLWLTDKATTAYEAFSDYKAVSTGESTLAEVGQRRGVEWAAGVVLGLGGRGLVKVLKAAIPSSSVKAAKSLWGGNSKSGSTIASSSKAARREAMRQQNIPTSRPAKSQLGSGDRKQYIYEGSNGENKVVTHHLKDKDHPNSHWHVADPRVEKGVMRINNYGQIRYKEVGKSTVEYK